MRHVLILVHCFESNRKRAENDFVQKVVASIESQAFDEVIHFKASRSWRGDDLTTMPELTQFITQEIEWNWLSGPGRLSWLRDDDYGFCIDIAEHSRILHDASSFKEAGYQVMEQAQWVIPLELPVEARRYADPIFNDDKDYHQYAWIPVQFRDPDRWRDSVITIGGLFEHQCVEDVRQILQWVGINPYVDPKLVSRGIK